MNVFKQETLDAYQDFLESYPPDQRLDISRRYPYYIFAEEVRKEIDNPTNENQSQT